MNFKRGCFLIRSWSDNKHTQKALEMAQQIVHRLMSLNLKIIKDTEIRKIKKLPTTIQELRDTLQQIYGRADYKLKYLDDQGDSITILTDQELQTAYQTARDFNSPSLKVYIEDSLSATDTSRAPESTALSESFQELKASSEQQIFQQTKSEDTPEENLEEMLFKEALKAEIPLSEISQLVKEYLENHIGYEREPIVWDRHTCDGCDCKPIRGIRYHCTVCEDFDFCEVCEANESHPHPFLKIRNQAAPSYIKIDLENLNPMNMMKQMNKFLKANNFISKQKPKMKLLGHVNFEKTEIFDSGSQVEKTWKVRNIGNTPWPAGCYLQSKKGESQARSLEIPCLNPGEDGDISALVDLPVKAGMYSSMFRLCTPEGAPFGNQLFFNTGVRNRNEEAIRKIVEMGFSKEMAEQALEVVEGDVDQAIQYLFEADFF